MGGVYDPTEDLRCQWNEPVRDEIGSEVAEKFAKQFTDRVAAEADARLEEYEKQKQMTKEEFTTVEVYQVAIHQIGGAYDHTVIATREALAITIDNAIAETEKIGGHVYVKKVKMNRRKIAT
jgi:hypothetical protein